MERNPELLRLMLNELQKREQNRNNVRSLRDASNPFELPEENFRQMYRLNVDSARDLFEEIIPHLNNGQRRSKIPTVVRFFSALHFLAHGSYQKSVAQDRLTGMSQPALSRCIHEVINVIVNHLSNNFIKFPRNPVEIANVKNGFFRKHEIPGIIGCIDCTHVKIVTPSFFQLDNPPNVFMNRKNFYSINCQLICDVNTKILAINARFPGSVHDSAIWTMSHIKLFLHENFLNGDQNTYLIGDSGYSLSPYLMTPINNALPETPEGRFNVKHKQIRNCVERTNGILKGVWRCLNSDRVLHYKPTFVSKIIYACATLHNFMRARNIPVDENLLAEIEDVNYVDNENIDDLHNRDLRNRGNVIRRRIVNDFFIE